MPSTYRLETVATHTIVPGFITPDAVIVDIGANRGEFAAAMVDRFGCHCVAVEACSQFLQQIPARDRIRRFHYAVTGSSGYVNLNIPKDAHDFPSLGRLADIEYPSTERVPARTLEALCAEAGVDRIDLLKMDIEGAELEVFASSSDGFLRRIDQVTVEFHEWAGVGSVSDVERIIRRMKGLGFFVFSLARKEYLDVLFVSSRRLSRAAYSVAWVKLWGPRVVRSAIRRSFGRNGTWRPSQQS